MRILGLQWYRNLLRIVLWVLGLNSALWAHLMLFLEWHLFRVLSVIFHAFLRNIVRNDMGRAWRTFVLKNYVF